MSEWVTGEVITAAKLNQKELFIGDTAPVSPTDGQLWYDTVNKVLKQYIAAEAAWKVVGGNIPVDKVIAPPPVAGDYQTPSAASESSAGDFLWLEQATTDYDIRLYAGATTRCGQRLYISAMKITKLGFYLYKFGSPTGYVYFQVRRVSDDSVIQQASINITTITAGAWKWYELSFTAPPVIDEEVRVVVEWTGGDINNRIEVACRLANVVTGYLTWYEDTTWKQNTAYDCTFRIYSERAGSLTIDDDLATYWEPSPPNETGAWIQWDLTGATIGGVSGLRVYWGTDAAYRPTNYDIDYSEDGTTWTQLVNETVDPGAGWKEYSWNPVASMRYLRLQVNTHGSSGTRVYEADYYQASIWRHGHLV